MKVHFIYSICKRWRTTKVKENAEYFVMGYKVLKHSDAEALQMGFAEPDGKLQCQDHILYNCLYNIAYE